MRYRYADGFEFEANTAREVCEALWHSMSFQFYDTLEEWLRQNAEHCCRWNGKHYSADSMESSISTLKPMGPICCATACSLNCRQRPRVLNEGHGLASRESLMSRPQAKEISATPWTFPPSADRERAARRIWPAVATCDPVRQILFKPEFAVTAHGSGHEVRYAMRSRAASR